MPEAAYIRADSDAEQYLYKIYPSRQVIDQVIFDRFFNGNLVFCLKLWNSVTQALTDFCPLMLWPVPVMKG